MFAVALKTLGAVLVAAVWVAETSASIPDAAKVALFAAGAVIGFAAIRAERGRHGGRPQ